MSECIAKLYRKAKPKARALLRCRRYYSISDLLLLYKAHVRSQIEWCNGAIFHAARGKLDWLDSVQTSFLRHLSLNESGAFLQHNLAPLQLRRDIGMLGVLWKVSRAAAHPDMCALLPLCPRSSATRRTRFDSRRHDRQFVNYCDGSQLQQFSRSIFGIVKVWNLLPIACVECNSVSSFQARLTEAARNACRSGVESWSRMYSVDSSPYSVLLKFCFVLT